MFPFNKLNMLICYSHNLHLWSIVANAAYIQIFKHQPSKLSYTPFPAENDRYKCLRHLSLSRLFTVCAKHIWAYYLCSVHVLCVFGPIIYVQCMCYAHLGLLCMFSARAMRIWAYYLCSAHMLCAFGPIMYVQRTCSMLLFLFISACIPAICIACTTCSWTLFLYLQLNFYLNKRFYSICLLFF